MAVPRLALGNISEIIEIAEGAMADSPTPINNRANGGGYIAVDVQDTNTMQELCRQAYMDLNAWKNRFEGVCSLSGVDVKSIEVILKKLQSKSIDEDVA